MSHRIDKVSRLIKEELSLILLYKYKGSDIGMVTITNVKMSPDLKIAKVYLSVFNKEKREELISRINDLKG